MHIVSTWHQDAKEKYAAMFDAATAGDDDVAHAHEDELAGILVRATLGGADRDTLNAIASLCAAAVFIDFTRRYK